MNRDGRVLPILLATLFVIYGIALTILNPPYQSPDEPTHLAQVMAFSEMESGSRGHIERQILDEMRVFKFWERVRFPAPPDTVERFFEAPLLQIRPSQKAKGKLYYLLMGGVVSVFHANKPVRALYVCRCAGVVFGAMTLLLIYFIVLQVRQNHKAAALSAAFTFVPQFIYMSASVNPAVLGWLLVSIVLLCLLKLFTNQPGFVPVLIGIPAMIAAVFTHRSSLVILPLWVPAMLRFVPSRSAAMQFRPAIFAGFGGITVATWMFVSLLSPGLLRTTVLHLQQLIMSHNFNISSTATRSDWWLHFMVMFNKSIWLAFGWLRYYAHRFYYFFMVLLFLPAALGVADTIIRPNAGDKNPWRKGVVIFLLLSGIQFLAATLFFALQGELSQGRYLFMTWAAIAPIWGIGHIVFGDLLGIRSWWISVLVLMAVMPFFAIWFVLLPAFYF